MNVGFCGKLGVWRATHQATRVEASDSMTTVNQTATGYPQGVLHNPESGHFVSQFQT
jgi:hypothetical protein